MKLTLSIVALLFSTNAYSQNFIGQCYVNNSNALQIIRIEAKLAKPFAYRYCQGSLGEGMVDNLWLTCDDEISFYNLKDNFTRITCPKWPLAPQE